MMNDSLIPAKSPTTLSSAMWKLKHLRRRRAAIRQRSFGLIDSEALEESCLPSYAHPNLLAAYAAWWRLFIVIDLLEAHGGVGRGPVLDFGSSTGELRHLIPQASGYEFVELHDDLVAILQREFAGARRRSTDELEPGRYAAIFALDSLEHVDFPEPAVGRLAESLAPGGVFILSGPTENALYRLGRRIAGFSGRYHKHSVYDIEQVAAAHLRLRSRLVGPHMLPLFAVSAWTLP